MGWPCGLSHSQPVLVHGLSSAPPDGDCSERTPAVTSIGALFGGN